MWREKWGYFNLGSEHWEFSARVAATSDIWLKFRSGYNLLEYNYGLALVILVTATASNTRINLRYIMHHVYLQIPQQYAMNSEL